MYIYLHVFKIPKPVLILAVYFMGKLINFVSMFIRLISLRVEYFAGKAILTL